MRKFFLIVLTGVFIINSVGGCSSGLKPSKSLIISAAASLKEPLEEIKASFEKNKNIKIDVNYGASGTLQKQIEEGAPVDIFISAGISQMDALDKKDLLLKSTTEDLLLNSLVLILSNSFDKNIKDISEIKGKNIKISLGEVNTVPAGQYAVEALKSLNVYSDFEKNIIYAKDEKSVVNYVEQGEVVAGIVYESEATSLKNSYVAYRIPSSSHKTIVYKVSVISSSKEKDLSKEFINYLKNSSNKKIFEKYKFKFKEK